MAKEKDKPLYVQVAERDDFSDLLRLIPDWVWGAVIWYAFTKIIIDPMVKPSALLGKPGTQLNAVLLAADIVTNLPPGVAVAAQVDVFLTALEIKEDFTTRTTSFILKTLQDFGAVPTGTKEGDPRYFGEVKL